MKETKKVIDINAHITNIECQIGEEGDDSKALISFDNLGYGTIAAVKFNATGYNSFGDIVQINGKNRFFLIIQDVSIEKNSHVKDLKAKIPDSNIRKLELEECQICYTDGSIVTYAGNDQREFDIVEYDTNGTDKEQLDALKDKFGDRFQYKPKEFDSGWICGCGAFNTTSVTTCSCCNHSKADIFKAADDVSVKMIVDEYKKNEEVRQQCEKKQNIKIIIGIMVGTVIGIILAVLIGYSIMMSGRTTYSSEDEMKSALQGTYTYYNSFGKASRQIVISGDNVTYKWNYSGSIDLNSTVNEWNYKKGTIKTFETLIVTKEGYLKDGEDIYKKSE